MSAAANRLRRVAVRGACPTLPEPMVTGDGLLARIALAAPMTPHQLAGLAALARRHGNGIVEVTARGKLQLRGLTRESAGQVAVGLGALGIALREGLEIQINPLAGLDPSAAFDPRPLADELGAAVVASGLAERLAPKLAVVVDGGGALRLTGLSADIRLEPAPGEGRLLLSAGIVPLAVVAEDVAVEAVLRLLSLVAATGRAARMADLWEEHGAAGLVAVLGGLSLEAPPLRGERPPAEPIGVHRLADGRVALGIGLAFGQSDAATLEMLAAHAAEAGAAGIMPAAGRALLIIGLTPNAAVMLRTKIAASDFITDPLDPRRQVHACPGSPACASARIATRGLAAQLAPLAEGRSVHVSGCAKGCAHPGSAALTIVGLDGGAGIVIEGTPRDAPVAVVPAERLGEVARRILETQGG